MLGFLLAGLSMSSSWSTLQLCFLWVRRKIAAMHGPAFDSFAARGYMQGPAGVFSPRAREHVDAH